MKSTFRRLRAVTGSFSCCGLQLPEQEAEISESEGHMLLTETVDNEYCITMQHSMSKNHFISFLAYVTSDSAELVKLYPEQEITVRFRRKGHGYLYAYCNRHGLFRYKI